MKISMEFPLFKRKKGFLLLHEEKVPSLIETFMEN